MAALTITSILQRRVDGARRSVVATVTPNASVAAGGDTVTPSQLGLSKIDLVRGGNFRKTSDGSDAWSWSFDRTNVKIQYYGGAASGSAVVEKTGDLSAYSSVLEFSGN